MKAALWGYFKSIFYRCTLTNEMTWYFSFASKNGVGAVDGIKLAFVCWLWGWVMSPGGSLYYSVYLYVHLKADIIEGNTYKTTPPPKPEIKLNIPMKWIVFFPIINKEVAAWRRYWPTQDTASQWWGQFQT